MLAEIIEELGRDPRKIARCHKYSLRNVFLPASAKAGDDDEEEEVETFNEGCHKLRKVPLWFLDQWLPERCHGLRNFNSKNARKQDSKITHKLLCCICLTDVSRPFGTKVIRDFEDFLNRRVASLPFAAHMRVDSMIDFNRCGVYKLLPERPDASTPELRQAHTYSRITLGTLETALPVEINVTAAWVLADNWNAWQATLRAPSGLSQSCLTIMKKLGGNVVDASLSDFDRGAVDNDGGSDDAADADEAPANANTTETPPTTIGAPSSPAPTSGTPKSKMSRQEKLMAKQRLQVSQRISKAASDALKSGGKSGDAVAAPKQLRRVASGVRTT